MDNKRSLRHPSMMKRRLLAAIGLNVLLFGPVVAETKMKPGEIIVKLKEESTAELTTLQQRHKLKEPKKLFTEKKRAATLGARPIAGTAAGEVYLLKADQMDVAAKVIELKKDPAVLYAEPNYQYKASVVPNDPQYNNQWGPKKIDAERAWDLTTGSPTVVIAIVDTGIDYNHPDLIDNIWTNIDEIPNDGIDNDFNGRIDDVRGWNFVGNNADPFDDNNHGTHCAGIAGAPGNNAVGMAGTSWRTQLMPVKGLDDDGSGYSSDLALAIRYAVDNGAHVINNSWGGGSYSTTLEDAVNYAVSRGAVVVFAAGNTGGETVEYPAVLPGALAVAATDANDLKASFSTYGSWVDVSAPGKNILSTIPGGYAYMDGTSMAAPFVSGLAGLIISRHPGYTNQQVRDIIEASTDDIYTLNPTYTGLLGSGRINAWKAFNTTVATYMIGGTILNSLGEGVSGAIVTLSGGSTATYVTGVYGYYEFRNLKLKSYFVTPSKPGHVFTPEQIVIARLDSNRTNQNFTASSGFSIKGNVFDVGGGRLEGARLTLTRNTTSYSTLTDAQGYYEFNYLAETNYVLKVTKNAYLFVEEQKSFSPLNANQENQNFVGERAWDIESGPSVGAVGTAIALSAGAAHFAAKNNSGQIVYSVKQTAWNSETVFNTSSLISNISLGIDALGLAHIATDGGGLNYLKRSGTGVWSIENIFADDINSSDLKLDNSGRPHIAFTLRSDNTVRYARWTGTSWTISTVATLVSSSYVSLALDQSNEPHIVAIDQYISEGIWYYNKTGTVWNAELIDTLFVRERPDIAVDQNKRPHIVYIDQLHGSIVRYATHNGTAWTFTTVTSGESVGDTTSIDVDATGVPHIVYREWANSDLRYARKKNGGWQLYRVDSDGDVGTSASLKVDGAGRPHISYYDKTNNQLKYARFIGSWPPAVSAYTISGRVKNHQHMGVAGATVTLTGGTLSLTVLTDATGQFSFSVLGGVYSMSCSKEGAEFTPNYITYAPLAANQENQDFTLNYRPVAVALKISTKEDVPLAFTLKGTDADNDKLVISTVSYPQHGILIRNTGNKFTYTPAPNFFGTDRFNFKAADGFSDSLISTVTITITSVNDLPVAVSDKVSIVDRRDLDLRLLDNDSDADVLPIDPSDPYGIYPYPLPVPTPTPSKDSLRLYSVQSPPNGTIMIFGNQVRYMPNKGFSGEDSFVYRIADKSGNISSSTVHVYVAATAPAGVNRAPVATDQVVVMRTNGSAEFYLQAADLDGTPLYYFPRTLPSQGTLNFTPGSSTVTYVANGTFVGTTTFQFHAHDRMAYSNPATVTIQVFPNQPPQAVNDSFVTMEDVSLPLNLRLNDFDPNGDLLTIAAVTSPQHGTLQPSTTSIAADFIYVPDRDYFGVDQFSYTLSDGSLTSTASVSIMITAVNDAPIATGDVAVATRNLAVDIRVGVNDYDVDSTSLVWSIFSSPLHGTVTVSTTPGVIRYQPANSYSGPDSFSYRIFDGSLYSNVATVQITVVNPNLPPIASNRTYDLWQGYGLSFNPGAIDPEGMPLTYSTITYPAHGTLTKLNPNNYGYTGDGYLGTVSFQYKANDGFLDSNIALITINNIPAPGSPVAKAKGMKVMEVTMLDPEVDPKDLYGNEAPRIEWTRVMGPGGVQFGNPYQLKTTAQFEKPGNYKLKLAFKWREFSISREIDFSIAPADLTNDPLPTDQPVSHDSSKSKNLFYPSRGESAELAYHLVKPGAVTITIYDRVNREIIVTEAGDRPAGPYTHTWDGRDSGGTVVPSGVYKAVITSGSTLVKKLKIVVVN